MQDSHISKLIVLYLKGELSDVHKEELTVWLKDKHNQELFNKITSKSAILNKADEYDADGMNDVWIKLDKQLFKKVNYTKWLSYAAVIILPLAITFFVLNQKTRHDDLCSQIQDIKSGGTHAKLYFSNGDVIDLKEDTPSFMRGKDNLLLEKTEDHLKINAKDLSVSEAVQMNRIVTPIGGEYKIELSDGTVVWLNADSYLEFPSRFSDKQRKVIVKGEVYFDVASDSDWPFIVEVQGVELKVLGTEFNLRAYSDENYVITTLIEGRVLVSNSLKNTIKLSPGNRVEVNTYNNKMNEAKADIESTIAWRNGRFVFKKRRVEDIMYDLTKWYDLEVFFLNSKVKDITMTLDVPRYRNIEDVLKLMEGTRELKFDISGHVISVK